MTDAYRACLLCGTRNPYYMLVCRHCGRSLRRAALVGTPPPGTVVPGTDGRGLRVALGVLALLAATAAVVAGVRFFRGGSFEASAAAAAEPAPGPAEEEGDDASWETLEQRLAELPPLPAPSTPAAASGPPPAPSVPPVPPSATSPAATPIPPPAAPTPSPRPRATAAPRVEPPPVEAEAEEVERDVRAARREDLRRAEERVRALERRASALRDRLREEELLDDDRAQLEDELASALLQLEDAERELVRAEWALRAVEE
jgi:outer membrane biosynthesis protein TonB